jgi:hypothetical protein
MRDWLLKRLSPARRKDERWTQLAITLQSFWESTFYPELKRLEDMRSIYTAHPQDLKQKMRELGDYFAPDMPTQNDQPLAVAWRKAEILRKDKEYLFESLFQRNFAGLDVRWIPLWADNRKPYGTAFAPADDLASWEKELFYFLTSRGKLKANLTHIHRSGRTKEEFLAIAEKLVRRFKPTHIVYDGIIFYINVDLEVSPFIVSPAFISKTYQQIDITFSHSRLLDAHPADMSPHLDEQIDFAITAQSNQTVALSFVPEDRLLSLDHYVGDDELPCDWLPLDLVRGDDSSMLAFSLFDVPYMQNISTIPIPAFKKATFAVAKKESKFFIEFEPVPEAIAKTKHVVPVPWGVRESSLDRYPKFDEVHCDFAPLDMVIGD